MLPSVAAQKRNRSGELAGYVLGFLTLINPFLYSYAKASFAKMEQVVGAVVVGLSVYQECVIRATKNTARYLILHM